MQTRMSHFVHLCAFIAVVALAACGKTSKSTVPAEAGLSINTSTVDYGDWVTLTWTVKNAAAARLSSSDSTVLASTRVQLTGSVDVRVTSDAVFTITALDRTGNALASADAVVTVRSPGSPDEDTGSDDDSEDPYALRFDFKDAVGIQLGNNTDGMTAANARSNLYKVLADGSLELALVNGTAHIQQFFIRNGKIYAVLYASGYWDSDAPNCVLAEINENGEVKCIDSEIGHVDVHSIQFDAMGGIYYRGYTDDGRPVIRKSIDGIATDFYTAADAITVEHFVATREGAVLLQGRSSGELSDRSWIRLIEDGAITAEFPYRRIIDYMPDGSIFTSNLTRFMTHNGITEDPRPYCGEPSTWTTTNARFIAPQARHRSLCSVIVSPWYTYHYRDSGNMFTLSEHGLVRFYPELVQMDLPLEDITSGAITLGKAAVAGFDATSAPRAFLVNLDTEVVTDMLGSRRIEVLRLSLRLDEHRVLMYGLDHERNQPIIAEYDLRVDQLNVADVDTMLAENFEVLDWTANHVPPAPTVPTVPVPEFAASVYSRWDEDTIAFDASAILPGTWLNEATWDFGDGTEITLPAHATPDEWLLVVHSYAEPGAYTVTLTLTDQLGNRHATSQLIHVPLGSE